MKKPKEDSEKGQDRESRWNEVYRLVQEIPSGKVMTYGQIALCIEPLTARAVGWAMNSCPPSVPWHRVVNSLGGCSTDRLPHVPTGLQRSLLEKEGVKFDSHEKLDLIEYRWFPAESNHQGTKDTNRDS